MKKHIFSSYLFKNEYFFKISKTNDYLNYLEKKVQKTLFFVTSLKLKILIKNVLLYRKRTFKHIRFGRSKSQVKGLSILK
jgi:hypothetical protein